MWAGPEPDGHSGDPPVIAPPSSQSAIPIADWMVPLVYVTAPHVLLRDLFTATLQPVATAWSGPLQASLQDVPILAGVPWLHEQAALGTAHWEARSLRVSADLPFQAV